jgi:hypothetical protein
VDVPPNQDDSKSPLAAYDLLSVVVSQNRTRAKDMTRGKRLLPAVEQVLPQKARCFRTFPPSLMPQTLASDLRAGGNGGTRPRPIPGLAGSPYSNSASGTIRDEAEISTGKGRDRHCPRALPDGTHVIYTPRSRGLSSGRRADLLVVS